MLQVTKEDKQAPVISQVVSIPVELWGRALAVSGSGISGVRQMIIDALGRETSDREALAQWQKMRASAVLFVLLLVAFTAHAQTALDLNRDAHCPKSSATQIVISLPSLNSPAPSACLILDPAGFKVDTSTTPPTVRVLVTTGPQGPAGAAGATGPAGAAGPAGAPGTAGPTVNFTDDDTACAAWPGASTFLLSAAPNPPSSFRLTRNGLTLKQGVDYTLAGLTVTFLLNPPAATDLVTCPYRH